MAFPYKYLSFVFSAYLASALPLHAQEQKRPYTSPNETLEFILQKYWEFHPSPLRCGWGEPFEVNKRLTFSIKEQCFGGSEPEYQIKIIREGRGKKGEIKLNLSQLTSFLEIDTRDKALLYKLTAVSEISEKLAEIILYDRSDRDYRKYKPLRDAVKKFGFQNILTYAKIMGS